MIYRHHELVMMTETVWHVAVLPRERFRLDDVVVLVKSELGGGVGRNHGRG